MEDSPKIIDLMPTGYLPILAQRTGSTDPSALSKLVRYEQTTNKRWPAVVKLAKETNPEGFARWEAAKAEATAA